MSSLSMMILALLWSPLLLFLLIQFALLPNGSNAAYEYDGIITNKIAVEVTDIFNKMSDNLKNERGHFLVEAFYAKGAFDKFKALSRTKVPHHEDVHQHQKEMEVLEKNILKIFSEVPNGKYEDNLKQKVENAIIAVGNAIAFFGPKKNPNDEHTSKKSKVEHEFGMFEEWEQMNKFHAWLQKVQEIVKVVKAGEEEKKDEKAKKEELEMARKILELLHEPGSPFIAPHEGGKVEEANENAEGSQHNIRKKLHHHHQHSADSEGPSEQPEVMKKEMTNDQASAHSDNHNHLLRKNGGGKDKQKSDGNDTR